MTREEIEAKLTQAEQQSNQGNHEEAERLCKEVLSLTEEFSLSFGHLPLEKVVKDIPDKKSKTQGKAKVSLPKREVAQQQRYAFRSRTLRLLSNSVLRRGRVSAALPIAEEALVAALQAKDRQEATKAQHFIGNVNLRIGDYSRALEYYKKVFATYEELGNKASAAGVAGNIGETYRCLGDYPRALEYTTKAIVTHEECGNKRDAAIVTGNIGIVHWNMGNYSRALEYYEKSLTAHEKLGMKAEAASVTGNIGDIYSDVGDYSRALEYYSKAVAAHEALGNEDGAAIFTGCIGIVHWRLGNYARSLEYYAKALAAYEELGMKAEIARVIGYIGHVYMNLGDYPRVLECYVKALAVHEELGMKAEAATITGNIGILHYTMGSYARALEYFAKAIAEHEELSMKAETARVTGFIGSTYAKIEFEDYDLAKAEQILLKTLAMSKELGAKQQLLETHKSLADLYLQKEQWKESQQHFKQYHELFLEVQSNEAKKKAEQMEQQKQIAERDKQFAVERARKDAEIAVTDRLLHKFLPSPVVFEVKEKEGNVLVEHYDSITVLFADLVGFTKLSMKIPPTAMIELLNFVFTHFDTIIKKHGGHRLRTMGDGYFAICGAPDKIENHAERFALAALEMHEDFNLPREISEHLPKGTEFEIRIGLHCGEAVCGLVGGLEKWQYDAYGDTVNTASRMESHGVPGKIHCTEEFMKAVGESSFHFTERGEMEIKGKGLMKTYFLEKQ